MRSIRKFLYLIDRKLDSCPFGIIIVILACFLAQIQIQRVNGDKVVLDLDGNIGPNTDSILEGSSCSDGKGASRLWWIRSQAKILQFKQVIWGSYSCCK